ncbi:carbon-nitrogen hydrolase family protein [Crenobacter sp. SG2305]|uniref:carbon-nitrogen hydrolase family protein n=1 Tax=Crenobacter oryzisoli TaxID=3056844 RepID=UPI0025AA8F6D|nr:carbon-nitrogen hydrolase family protein [Crenobacter sp. SG2305]MDN0084535.1 carbon-nitrogen hydrolase family protein [Crenobacter sp. SG2305]
MQPVSIRLCQTSCRDGDVDFNLDKTLAAIADSRGKTELLVLPETFISGFPTPGDIASLAEPLNGPSVTAIRATARASGVSVAFGFAEEDGGRYYNTAVLVDASGDILLTYRKTHLYESDQGVFEPGRVFPVCEWRGIKVGLLICFDIEFPESARALARLGAELILVLDGMMEPYNRVHRTMVPVRAMENQLFIALCNRVGEGERYRFCGQSQVADSFGNNLVIASDSDEAVIDMELDLSAVAKAREEYSYLALASDADWSK